MSKSNLVMWRIYLKLDGQKKFRPYGGRESLQVTNLIFSPLYTTHQKNHLLSEGIIKEFQSENLIKAIEFRPVNMGSPTLRE